MFQPIKFGNERDSGVLTTIHTADLHFGKLNPKIEYEILCEQMLEPLKNLHFDIFSIDGDIFHRKYMSNTEPVLYATLFIRKVVELCKMKQATLFIIDGTREHDAGQLRLFYHYLEEEDIDIRIVENISFEYVKGHKILCIPELCGIDESIYQKYLFHSGYYDMCFMHGTIKGAIYKDTVNQSRLFTIEDFSNCKGPIISGHVHTGGCFNSYFYYTGSPLRWKFGEEEEKGFLIVLYNTNTREHYTYLQKIKSFRYDTINLDELISSDPKDIIEHIDRLHEEGIDNIRIEFTKEIPTENLNILKNYYRNKNHIKFKIPTERMKGITDTLNGYDDELYQKYSYLYDNSLDEYEKLARFINANETDVFLTGEQLKNILDDID